MSHFGSRIFRQAPTRNYRHEVDVLSQRTSEDEMYLQGNLQLVFDALFTIGAIDPVLKMDWQQVSAEIENEPQRLHSMCEKMNSCGGNFSRMIEILKTTDSQSINFLALEVAREFCEFQDRETLH